MRLLAAALVALIAPKCLLCLAGYLAAGGAMVELCGGTPDDHSLAWWIGGATGVTLLVVGSWCGCPKRRTASGSASTR